MSDYSFIDLHIHTIYSHENMCDDTVQTVLEDAQAIANRSGKDCLLAITDHNTVLGVSEARRLINTTGKYNNVKLISGAEFTVDMSEINGVFGGRKVFGNCHILAYGFNENDPGLTDFSRKFHANKTGYLKFSQLVNLIKNAGGYLVIAHPGLIKVFPSGLVGYSGSEYRNEIDEMSRNARSSKTILRYVPNGKYLLKVFYNRVSKLGGGIVKGMERFHPDNYFKEFDKSIEEICNSEGLIQTAGSDFHGYHLHTDFSVGNPFTRSFQEFYKDALQDSQQYRCGLHVSHLPGIEALAHEETSDNDKEIRMITANGETVTYEQYNQVVDAIVEKFKRESVDNTSNRYSTSKKPKSGKSGKKGKGGKKSHHKKGRNRYYYPERDLYEGELTGKQINDIYGKD